jgi:hypothetical protein
MIDKISLIVKRLDLFRHLRAAGKIDMQSETHSEVMKNKICSQLQFKVHGSGYSTNFKNTCDQVDFQRVFSISSHFGLTVSEC